MKHLQKPHRYRITAQGLVLGLGLWLRGPAGAAELLKNGDFEQPIGLTNWTVGYIKGEPNDFEIKDRTRAGSLHSAWFGGTFRPYTLKLAHAYFTQTVTNLATNHTYTVTGSMKEEWWKGLGDPKRDKYLVYIEVIGVQGTPTGDGRASVIAATDPDADIDPPYTFPTDIWRDFTAQQTPDAKGKIEVRLHYNKVGYTIYDKTWIMAGYFDDLSMVP